MVTLPILTYPATLRPSIIGVGERKVVEEEEGREGDEKRGGIMEKEDGTTKVKRR